jgi:Antibiotic biosynthesis monooxygenase
MIRVMYRWTVKPGNEAEFTRHWDTGTREIQSKCKGAMGSILVRSRKSPELFFGIARWESREAWKIAQPQIMNMGLQGPMPETIEFYDEIADQMPVGGE